jgi:iron complex transport system ATP-binding protein
MVDVIIQNLSLQIGNKPILKDIDHSFSAGKFSAIMGKNGSGKTSLLRCIMQQKKTYEGSITIQNRSTKNLTPEEMSHCCALVPQGQDLIFNHSVFETVLVGRLPYIQWKPSKKDLEITAQILEELNLTNFSHRYLQELSGGERQKVFIARALAQQTPIILLDEPITYLDIKHQLEIMSLLKSLASKGFNVIMVVHDLNLALSFCDEFVFMKEGLLIRHGDKSIIDAALIKEAFDVELKAFRHENGDFFFFPTS